MTRAKRALAAAIENEAACWKELQAHKPEECIACDFAATRDRCQAHYDLYSLWCSAKGMRMLAEARAL